jgi:hypothetical protein
VRYGSLGQHDVGRDGFERASQGRARRQRMARNYVSQEFQGVKTQLP